ncbi:hypothetical protein FACS189434_01660 [Bacteroidia bacterium]|nr:hypothetical protein FACS189434_01660 [Bacteroidia bacterium]
MKKIAFLVAAMPLMLAGVLMSCNKSDDGGGSAVEDERLGTISQKWEIEDADSPYASFEFTKAGNYIVVENGEGDGYEDDWANYFGAPSKLSKSLFSRAKALKAKRAASSNLSPIHFGTYRIDGDKIILSGFGTLEIISLTAEEFAFSFTLEQSDETSEYHANRAADAISSSSRTDMLCKTWQWKGLTIDDSGLTAEERQELIDEGGSNWKNDFTEMLNEELRGMSVIISKAGTYLVLYDGDMGEGGLAEWKWANAAETTFYYSWDNWKYFDEDEDRVEIKELTDKKLVIKEEFEGLVVLEELTAVK